MSPLDAVLYVGVGLVAGIANTVAGGGSLLAVPMLIFTGLPALDASATTRPAIVAQCMASTLRFRRDGHYRDASERRIGLLIAACAIPGAVAGALFASRKITNDLFETLIAIIMMAVLAFTLWRRLRPRVVDEASRRERPFMLAVIFLLVGLYGGFVQAGVGFVITAALLNGTTWSLKRVTAHKNLVVLAYMTVAMIAFAIEGRIHWGVALTMAAGQSMGGWLGAVITEKIGEAKLMAIFSILMIVFALALILR